jgi:hypothetical protein
MTERKKAYTDVVWVVKLTPQDGIFKLIGLVSLEA